MVNRPTPPGTSQPTLTKAALGAAAETRAAEYLQSQGLIVLARNLRCKSGELDLVCLHGEVLVIVEVRQRGRIDYGGASASVTPLKQRKLIRATRFFWQRRREWQARIMRFDVIALRTAAPGSGTPDLETHGVGPPIEWIQDAFRAD